MTAYNVPRQASGCPCDVTFQVAYVFFYHTEICTEYGQQIFTSCIIKNHIKSSSGHMLKLPENKQKLNIVLRILKPYIGTHFMEQSKRTQTTSTFNHDVNLNKMIQQSLGTRTSSFPGSFCSTESVYQISMNSKLVQLYIFYDIKCIVKQQKYIIH